MVDLRILNIFHYFKFYKICYKWQIFYIELYWLRLDEQDNIKSLIYNHAILGLNTFHIIVGMNYS